MRSSITVPTCVGAILCFLLLLVGYYQVSHSVIHAFDTGLYLQILSNLLREGSWASSVTGEANFLAHHFQPILILLAPLHSLHASSLTLFSVSAFAIFLGLLFFFLTYREKMDLGVQCSLAAWLVLYPSIANRIMYSFVPEVLAFPFLILQAVWLSKGLPKGFKGILALLGVQIASGLCKENIWLVNAFCCLLFAYRERDRYPFFLTFALANLGVFSFLFTYWMPAHTNLPAYYGLKYYANASVGEINSFYKAIEACLLNLFSLRSLETLVSSILLFSLFLPLIRPGLAALSALPGICLILFASHPIVHSAQNHYQLLVVPFLLVANAEAIYKVSYFQIAKVRRWLLIFLPIVPFVLGTLPSLVRYHRLIEANPKSEFIAADVHKVRDELQRKQNLNLIVDGNLQPLFHDFVNVKVLSSFVGNPLPLTEKDFQEATDIVTMNDLSEIEDCQKVKASKEDRLEYDYTAFYTYCQWLKARKLRPSISPQSGLVHFETIKP